MERDSPDKKMLDHVRSLLICIGEVTKDDERLCRASAA
jgi:hypothetical protein